MTSQRLLIAILPALCALLLHPRAALPDETTPPPTALVYRAAATGIEAVDISGGQERPVATLPLPGPIHSVHAAGDWLYVARGTLGITLVDVRDAEHPVEGLSFGGGPNAIRAETRGWAVLVYYSDAPPVAFARESVESRSRAGGESQTAPRPLMGSAAFSDEQGPPDAAQTETLARQRDQEADPQRVLLAVGATLALSGVLLSGLGLWQLHEGDNARLQDQIARQMRHRMCKSSITDWCLDLSLGNLFAGLDHDIAGTSLLAAGAPRLLAAVPMLLVGGVRLHRSRPRR